MRNCIGFLFVFMLAGMAGCGDDTTTLFDAGLGDGAIDATLCSGDETLCGETCVDLNTSAENCGGCDMACAAGQVCSAGSCEASCGAGLTDCAGSCQDLMNDPTACGGCGIACPSGAGATPICSMGACGIICDAGFADCNGDPSDGGEVDLAADADNCGACGSVCTLPNGTASCSAGTCGVDTCADDFDDCNMDDVDGCEASLQTDSENCGACGTICPAGQFCSMGVCAASCAEPLLECGLDCVNQSNDPTNCGSCDNVCPDQDNSAPVCADSSCAFVCDAGFANCDAAGDNGCEVDTVNDSANCGACGTVCAAEERCGGGVCLPAARLVAPIFSAGVTSVRPTLEVDVSGLPEGVRIELCTDRACGTVIETIDAATGVAQPTADLSPGIVWWRATTLAGGEPVAGLESATWYFVAPIRDLGTDTYFGQQGDLNGDGFADVVIGSRNTGTATVSYGSATGVSAMPDVTLTVTPAGPFTSPQFGDFNGDGYSDLWISRINLGEAHIFFGSPTGVAATADQIITAEAPIGWFAYRSSGAGDINRDGYADLVLTHWSRSPALLMVAYGSAAGITDPVEIGTSTGGSAFYRVAGVGDLNGDRYADVVGGDPFGTPGNSVVVYYGSATGTATTPDLTITAPTGAPSNWGYVANAVDMNGDGYSDLVVSANSSSANNVHFFAGGPTGPSMTPTATGSLGGGGYVAAGIGDANGDGYGDVVFGDTGSTGRILLGSAAGMPAAPNATITGGGRGITATGDVNGDGFRDWVGSNGSNMAGVWYGQMSIPATPAADVSWTVMVSGYGYPLN